MRMIALLLVLFAMNLNAVGQSTKLDDIKDLIEFTGMDQLGKQIADSYATIYKANYGDNIPGLWDTLNVVMQEGMKDLTDSIALIYDEMYTHEEILQMVELYQTPIGKKMIETLPLLTENSMRAGQNWAMANSDKIEERIAPLVEKYANKEFTFEDFYDPDEIYEFDTPKTVTSPESNNVVVHGSEDYKYSIHYNPIEWETVPNESINPSADLTFVSKNQEVYAMVMAENSLLSMQQLKAAAIYNMSNAAENVRTKSLGLRDVNGKEILCMKLAADINGATFNYYNYYYSGEWGVLQYIVFTSEEAFSDNKEPIEGLLAGLHVE